MPCSAEKTVSLLRERNKALGNVVMYGEAVQCIKGLYNLYFRIDFTRYIIYTKSSLFLGEIL